MDYAKGNKTVNEKKQQIKKVNIIQKHVLSKRQIIELDNQYINICII